jgi:hypothetical protein
MVETSMGGTFEESTWARDSLFVLCDVYVPLGGGRFLYYGERPGETWYGHGYFPKTLTVLRNGRPPKIELHKHRWKDQETGVTVHSRPPDDPAYIRCCSLIVVLRIWTFISSGKGIHKREEVFPSLWKGSGSSSRTVQRWTKREFENSMEIQQAIRHLLIDENEPRPVEGLFEGGLSPPDGVLNRRWKSSTKLSELYRAYAMLFVAAREYAQHASYLLAWAQRRMPKQQKTFGL